MKRKNTEEKSGYVRNNDLVGGTLSETVKRDTANELKAEKNLSNKKSSISKKEENELLKEMLNTINISLNEMKKEILELRIENKEFKNKIEKLKNPLMNNERKENTSLLDEIEESKPTKRRLTVSLKKKIPSSETFSKYVKNSLLKKDKVLNNIKNKEEIPKTKNSKKNNSKRKNSKGLRINKKLIDLIWESDNFKFVTASYVPVKIINIPFMRTKDFKELLYSKTKLRSNQYGGINYISSASSWFLMIKESCLKKFNLLNMKKFGLWSTDELTNCEYDFSYSLNQANDKLKKFNNSLYKSIKELEINIKNKNIDKIQELYKRVKDSLSNEAVSV